MLPDRGTGFRKGDEVTTLATYLDDGDQSRPTPADWRSAIEENIAAAQAMITIADIEGRDELTEGERERFDLLLEEVGTGKQRLQDAENAKEAKLAKAKMALATGHYKTDPMNLGYDQERPRQMSDQVHHRIGPLKCFKGGEAVRDAYSSGQWLKAVSAKSVGRHDANAESYLQSIGIDINLIATEGDPGAGGYLVPAPLSNAIVDVRALAGVSRQLARVMPMTSETLSVPKKLTGTTVYYPGETGTITPSDQSWGQLNLTAKKRAILSKMSNELKDDAIISLVDDWVSQVGTDFAVKEDAEFVRGDGTSTYGGEVGLLTALGSAGVFAPANGGGKSVWSGLKMADFNQTMAKLPSRFQARGTAWLCSTEFYFGVMLPVLAEAGGNTMATLEQGGAAVPAFMGRRVFLTDQMPRTTATSQVSALYGSFGDAAMIGSRKEITVALSEHLNFAEDMTAMRAVSRYDILVHESGDGAEAGAYVALATAAS